MTDNDTKKELTFQLNNDVKNNNIFTFWLVKCCHCRVGKGVYIKPTTDIQICDKCFVMYPSNTEPIDVFPYPKYPFVSMLDQPKPQGVITFSEGNEYKKQ